MQKWSANTIFRSTDTQLDSLWELSKKTKRVQLQLFLDCAGTGPLTKLLASFSPLRLSILYIFKTDHIINKMK